MSGKLHDAIDFFVSNETFRQKNKFICSMSTTSKIAVIGVGLASGALLAAWLLTGTRKEMTKKFISSKTATLKKSFQVEKKGAFDDSEVHYI